MCEDCWLLYVDFVSCKCTCITYRCKLFLVEDKGSFNYIFISFENRYNLTSVFPNFIPCIWALHWMREVIVGILVSFLIVLESDFHFPMWDNIGGRLLYMVFITLKYVSFILHSFSTFIMIACWALSSRFSASVQKITYFFHKFIYMLYCIY